MNVLFKMPKQEVIDIERKKKADAEAKIKAIEESLGSLILNSSKDGSYAQPSPFETPSYRVLKMLRRRPYLASS